MLSRVLKYGVIAGLAVGIPLSAFVLTSEGGTPPAWGMAIGYLTMLVALSLVFVAVKRERDETRGGVIRFWPAFGMGLAISAVAGVFYVIAWESASAASGMDFASDYVRSLIEQKRADGVSGEALARYAAELDDFKRNYANPLYRLPMIFAEIFPVGVLVSLVSAALLRNSRFLPARPA